MSPASNYEFCGFDHFENERSVTVVIVGPKLSRPSLVCADDVNVSESSFTTFLGAQPNLLYFWLADSNFCIFRMTNVHQCTKWTFSFRVVKITSFLHFTCFVQHCSRLDTSRSIGSTFLNFFVIHRIQSSFRVVIFMISRMSGFQTLSRGFMRLPRHMHTLSFHWILWSLLPQFLAAPFCRFLVPIWQGIAASIGTFNFFLPFCGFLVFSILRINEVNFSQSSRCRTLVFHLATNQSKSQATRIWSGSCLDLRKSLPRRHFSLMKFWFKNETSWILSMKLTIFESYRRSKSHQYVFLGVHPDLWYWEWFLFRHVEFRLTRNHYGLQRHLSVSVGWAALAVLEVFPSDFDSLQVGPAEKWELLDSVQTSSLLHFPTWICNFKLFFNLILHLHWAFEREFSRSQISSSSTSATIIYPFQNAPAILNMSKRAAAFHRIGPPFFIQARLQQYRRRPPFCSSYCSYSCRISGMSKYDDYMISLHWICQVPMSCLCKWLSAFPKALKFL